MLEQPINTIEKYKILIYDLSSTAFATKALELLGQENIFNFDDSANIWAENSPILFELKKKIVSFSAAYQKIYFNAVPNEIAHLDGWFVSTANSNTHLKKHHHRGHSDMNCLYYICADPDDAGPIEIYLENDENTEPHSEHFLFTPHSGALIFFPGGSPHRVKPYERLRLSIATNIKLQLSF